MFRVTLRRLDLAVVQAQREACEPFINSQQHEGLECPLGSSS